MERNCRDRRPRCEGSLMRASNNHKDAADNDEKCQDDHDFTFSRRK